MPAFLTHWHILIETAWRSQDAGNDLGSLIMQRNMLQQRIKGLASPEPTSPAGAVWNTGPLPEIAYRFPGSDISAMAYLGALAPDIPSYLKGHFAIKRSFGAQQARSAFTAPTDGSIPWHILFHTNRSGDILLTMLERIADVPSPALRSQMLAFAMGYLSHIAADIALNPYINALASAYSAKDLPGLHGTGLSKHFYVEFCIDELLAIRTFASAYYGGWKQPWGHYIEPAARAILDTTALTGRTLELLLQVAESIYGLNEAQCQALRSDYLAGVQRVRQYLAGQGAFRWFTFQMGRRKRRGDPLIKLLATRSAPPGTVTLDSVLTYAIRLSERLCRRAISYYASLRNLSATAQERSERRAALREDLRNWDLYTGYTLDVAFDQEVTLRVLHNWIHFADIWDAITPVPPEQSHTLHNRE